MSYKFLPSWVRWLFETLAIAVIYYGAARLGLLLAFEETNATPVWAPSGIAFAALLILGYRVWPGIMLGAFMTNLMVFLQNQVADLSTMIWASGFISLGNTLETLTGAFFFNRFIGYGTDPLFNAGNTFKFMSIALIMCLVASTIGPTYLCLYNIVPWEQYPTVWFTWWLGDAIGVLVMTPLLLAWVRPLKFHWNVPHFVESVLLFILLYLSLRVGFGGLPFKEGIEYPPIMFISIPFLVWAVFRFSKRVVTAAILIVAVEAVWETVQGFGPFVRPTINESLLLLQAYVGIVTVTILVMESVIAERARAREEVRLMNEVLEQRVAERTEQLQSMTDKLLSESFERKEAEETLMDERLKVERINAEREHLKLFSMIVSHDLQSPLQKILGYSSLLETVLAKHLDEKSRGYLSRIKQTTLKMGQLIESLLHFSQVTTQDKPVERVNLNEVIDDVISDLEFPIKRSGAKIERQPLPMIQGDKVQMRELFFNLISNALKFQKKADPLHVRIGSEVLPDGSLQITVSDNGIGFDPKLAKELFKPFQRLHREEEYEGHGMGLAICQRIVTRHGGKITAKSKPGEGAAFSIIIPTNILQQGKAA